MLRIKEVTLVNEHGNEDTLSVQNYRPLKDFQYRHDYLGQFRDVEKEVLDYINEDEIKEYAEFYLDMVEECEEKDLADFSDDEITGEYMDRLPANLNDVTMLQVEIQKLCEKIVASNNYKVVELLEDIIEKHC